MTDNEYRDYIINHPNSNIFIVAGAGSGKTTILVDRMVSLVEEDENVISKICAITFTKNAAKNFLYKFEKKLKQRSKMTFEEWQNDKTTHLKAPTDITKERCKKALININQCFAGTIDSFCNLIIQEHPLEASLPSSSRVLEDDEMNEIYKKEFKAISDGVEPYIKLLPKLKVFSLLHSNPIEAFCETISEVMQSIILDVSFNRPTKSLNESLKDFELKYRDLLVGDIKYLLNHENDVVDIETHKEAFIAFKNSYSFFAKKEWNYEYYKIKKYSYYCTR